ncbi:MAG: V-type ATPase 116kDa subunit family protein [Oscillospiraceae bacterium]
MAIVRMQRLCTIVPFTARRQVLRTLYRLGCVEIESSAAALHAQYGDVLHTQEENTGAEEQKNRLTQAAAALNKYAPCKTSLLTPRTAVREAQLFDVGRLAHAVESATQIMELTSQIDEACAQQGRLGSRIAAIAPWTALDVPLDYEGSAMTGYFRGVVSVSTDTAALMGEMGEALPATVLSEISSDNEQRYLTLLVYKPDEEEALSLLKSHGFMLMNYRDIHGNALDKINNYSEQIAALGDDIAGWINQICAMASERKLILSAIDAYTQEAEQDGLLSAVGQTQRTVILTGWTPAEAAERVGSALIDLGCAYQFCDPTTEDQPPTAMRNGKLVDPFTGVTEMYGTPTYGSMIDPNPTMSIFYFIFFGFIMGDAMYGVLMVIGSWIYLKKARPSGGTKRMMTMFMYCGVSTFVAGALTGGWFGNAAQALSLWITGTEHAIAPLWFDPLKDPMRMLVFSLVLGGIQIVTGMALSGLRMIKQGHPLDALCDVGSWYVIFIGIGLLALGYPAGPYVAIFGVLIILLTGGRKNKGIGKITGGLSSLYSITSYVSDLLSYSRIMALGMSGAVVGQVVNTIATMATGIPGVLLCVVVFVFGHVFNLAISLLGAYVHTSRLQYIEFFGKFFEDGGRPFKPLWNHTKFVEIIEED